jgi:adenylosuccinate synthase
MRQNFIVVGLGFGDEGKGSIVDYLVRKVENPLVVRFNGGAQAAHNVVLPDKKHHEFSQFGAGTLAGAPTYLSEFTVLNPANMINEAMHLATLGVVDPYDSLYIAEGALVVTPYHITANRMREEAREASGEGRHGSCGQGIGETVEFALRFPESTLRMRDVDAFEPAVLRDKLAFIRAAKRQEMIDLGIDVRHTIFDDDEAFQRIWMGLRSTIRGGPMHVVGPDWLEHRFDWHDVIFEGAQGVLLDERLGFHPHTTWSKTTPHNAKLLLNGRDAYTLGVTRTYTTRHGAGPFPTDMGSLGERMFPEHHNGTGEYQGAFRRGGFDAVAFEYGLRSMRAQGHDIDGLAMTHMGRIPENVPYCGMYESETGRRHYSVELPTFDDLGFNEACIEAQEEATKWISEAKPVYEIMPRTSDFTHAVEDLARKDIVIESWGPTHEDKKDFQ